MVIDDWSLRTIVVSDWLSGTVVNSDEGFYPSNRQYVFFTGEHTDLTKTLELFY